MRIDPLGIEPRSPAIRLGRIGHLLTGGYTVAVGALTIILQAKFYFFENYNIYTFEITESGFHLNFFHIY